MSNLGTHFNNFVRYTLYNLDAVILVICYLAHVFDVKLQKGLFII